MEYYLGSVPYSFLTEGLFTYGAPLNDLGIP
jgi:hypothetical protein